MRKWLTEPIQVMHPADIQCLRDTAEAGELEYGSNRLRRAPRLLHHGLIEPVHPHGGPEHLVTEQSSTGGWVEWITYCPRQLLNHQNPPKCMRLYRVTEKGQSRLKEYTERMRAERAEAEVIDQTGRADIAADRIVRLEAALRDFATHGLRADLNPTGRIKNGVFEPMMGWHAYLKSIDSMVRERAKEALREKGE